MDDNAEKNKSESTDNEGELFDLLFLLCVAKGSVLESQNERRLPSERFLKENVESTEIFNVWFFVCLKEMESVHDSRSSLGGINETMVKKRRRAIGGVRKKKPSSGTI